MLSTRTLLPALLIAALAPSTAAAATVSVTGDDGNPVALNTTAPTGIRNMDVKADVVFGASETPYYTTQVFDQAGTPASTRSPCRAAQYGPTWTNYTDYRGNGTYTVVLRSFAQNTCATATQEQRYQYTVNAGTAVSAPTGAFATRPRNSFTINTNTLGITQNPGASLYEIRYALGGVVGADGAISGPSAEAYLDRTTGQAAFRFDRPGNYTLVVRAKADDFFTAWSAPVTAHAVAPFDLERVTFPDARGPSYRIRGQIRERTTRGRVTVAMARGTKRGRYHRVGSARISRTGSFLIRFRQRRSGTYRVRYSYRGSPDVAKGSVVERVRITRRIFFR